MLDGVDQLGTKNEQTALVILTAFERKLGEMLAALPRAPGPGRGKTNAASPESFLKTLAAE